MLQPGPFTLIAIPYATLNNRWPLSIGQTTSVDVLLDIATCSNPRPADISGLSILRYNVVKPAGPKGGLSVITIHSFIPSWRKGGNAEKGVPEEIFVVGFDKAEIYTPDTLLSWRFQHTRSSLGLDPSVGADAGLLSSIGLSHENTPWHLALVASFDMLPWNTRCIMNSGRMLSFYKGLFCITLFSDDKQLKELLKPANAVLIDSLETIDPYSGVFAIQTPGKVRIMELA